MAGELDAPNQQVVRADASAPWDEGTGGEAGGPEPAPVDPLEEMTKNDLLAYAEEQGVDVNAQMNKDDLKAAIRQAG